MKKQTYDINRDFVRTIKPTGAQQDFADRTIAGFVLRMTPKGAISYALRYRKPDGSFGRKKVGNYPELAPADAREVVKRELQITDRKGDSTATTSERRARREREIKRTGKLPTIRVFLDTFYEGWLKAHRKGGAALATLIRNHFPDLLDKPLDELTTFDLSQWKIACIQKGNTEATVARKLSALQGLYTVAIEEAELLSVNPVTQIMKKTDASSNRIIRYLSDDERVRLYAALVARENAQRDMRERYNAHRRMRKYKPYPSRRDVAFTDYLRPAVILALNTGLRRGELLALRWSDVVLEGTAPMITVERGSAKADRARHIPLNREALDTLTAWKPLAHPVFVFGNVETDRPITDIKKSWEAVLVAARLPDSDDAHSKPLRWHDMRHDFASRLVMAGVDLNRVCDLLGHADLKMTLRYAHLAPKHLADAVSVLRPPRITKRRLAELKLAA